MFVINGPPAAGKTTLSRALMARFEKGIHIPVDDLREWVVSGIAQPMDWSDETARQFRLAEEAAADVALRYRRAGFAVAFDHCRLTENIDWLTDERLGGSPVYRVLLHSSLERNLARNEQRKNKEFDPEVLTRTIRGLNPQMSPDGCMRPGWTYLNNETDGIEEAVDRLLKETGLRF